MGKRSHPKSRQDASDNEGGNYQTPTKTRSQEPKKRRAQSSIDLRRTSSSSEKSTTHLEEKLNSGIFGSLVAPDLEKYTIGSDHTGVFPVSVTQEEWESMTACERKSIAFEDNSNVSSSIEALLIGGGHTGVSRLGLSPFVKGDILNGDGCLLAVRNEFTHQFLMDSGAKFVVPSLGTSEKWSLLFLKFDSEAQIVVRLNFTVFFNCFYLQISDLDGETKSVQRHPGSMLNTAMQKGTKQQAVRLEFTGFISRTKKNFHLRFKIRTMSLLDVVVKDQLIFTSTTAPLLFQKAETEELDRFEFFSP